MVIISFIYATKYILKINWSKFGIASFDPYGEVFAISEAQYIPRIMHMPSNL